MTRGRAPVARAAAALALAIAFPAQAQVAGSIAIASNELFRGDSLSDESPVLRGALSLDLPDGFFAGGSISLAQREGGVRAVASSQYAGWALRAGQVSIEAGAIHRHYALIADHDYRPDYFEIFAGVNSGKARLRLSVSPDYLRSGHASYYGDAGLRLFRLRGVAFDGHAGLSLIPEGGRNNRLVPYVDASVDASRALGPFTVTATIAWTNYPVFGAGHGPRVAASIGKSF